VTLVNQPHWATPLVTTNARVEQDFRTADSKPLASLRNFKVTY
jgi:hypothetical protein